MSYFTSPPYNTDSRYNPDPFTAVARSTVEAPELHGVSVDGRNEIDKLVRELYIIKKRIGELQAKGHTFSAKAGERAAIQEKLDELIHAVGDHETRRKLTTRVSNYLTYGHFPEELQRHPHVVESEK